MKHIAASGAKTGQWVNCPAQIKCTLKGTVHADENTLTKVRLWKQDETNSGKRLPVSSLTREDYEKFMTLPEEEKDIYDQILIDQMRDAEKRKEAQRRRDGSPYPVTGIGANNKNNPDRPVLEGERVVQPSYIIFENGFRCERANYTEAQLHSAEATTIATLDMVEKWKTGSLEPGEAEEYRQFMKRNSENSGIAGMRQVGSKIADHFERPYRERRNGSMDPDLLGRINVLQDFNNDVLKGYAMGSSFIVNSRGFYKA